MRIVTVLTAVALSGCIGDLPPPGGAPDAGNANNPTPDAFIITNAARTLLANWSGCMTLANFQAAKMADTWGKLLTLDNKECQGCHNDGAYGFIASADEAKFFAMITQHSGYMAMYFSADVPGAKVNINTGSFVAANATAGHPPFNPTTNAGMTALQTFYTSTAAITACDPPRMID